MNDTSTSANRGISRRSVAKGMAWSVPVVAVATAAPAIAASGLPPAISVTRACKLPGNSCGEVGFNKGYVFLVTITNPSNKTIYLYPKVDGGVADPYMNVTSVVPFTYDTARKYTGGLIGAPLNASEAIAPGGSLTIIIYANTQDNSQNTSAVGTLFMPWGHTAVEGGDLDHPYTPGKPSTNPGPGYIRAGFSFADTPPCVKCAP